MSEGKQFLEKCLNTNVKLQPWPYQLIENTLSDKIFEKLQRECIENLNFKTEELIQIHPNDYKKYNIDF